MKTTIALVSTIVSLVAPSVFADVFADDFESGTMSLWTSTATTPSPLTIQSETNIVPVGGFYSAYLNTSTDRMHHNIIGDNGGVELSGHTSFTSYWYDNLGTASRIFNEVRGYTGGTGLPNGGTAASGALAQLLAIGKYNSVTLLGEVFNGTKYQARVTFGSNAGWFNLDGPGSPSRSAGWHKFTLERLPDETTINFYVDDILSRTITGATAQSWDTVILGPGLGTTVGDAWVDGISIVVVPEPSTVALSVLGGAALCFMLIRRRR